MSDLIGRSGIPAEVNDDFQLMTEAMTLPISWKRAVDDGELWTLPISATPTGANDHFFHLENTYEERSIAVISIALVRAATSESITILSVGGTSTSPTAITPVSWAVGSTKLPQVTAENGADLQLTSLATLETFTIDTTRTVLATVNFNTPIILRPNAAIVFNAVTGTSAITGNVMITTAD